MVGNDREDTETEGSDRESGEQGVQGGDVEQLSNCHQRPLIRCC